MLLGGRFLALTLELRRGQRSQTSSHPGSVGAVSQRTLTQGASVYMRRSSSGKVGDGEQKNDEDRLGLEHNEGPWPATRTMEKKEKGELGSHLGSTSHPYGLYDKAQMAPLLRYGALRRPPRVNSHLSACFPVNASLIQM